MVQEILNRNIINDDIIEIIELPFPWERLYNKKFFITGGTSYLMNYFIRVLLKLNEIKDANIKIVIMARSRNKVEHLFPDFDIRLLDIVYGDICNSDWFQRGAADYFINAASPANPAVWYKSPFETLEALTLGTRNALKACKNGGVEKLLHISSGVVYGTDTGRGQRLKEDCVGKIDFNKMGNIYAIGKIAGELFCQSFMREYEINYSVARPFIIYGPNMDISMKKAFTDFLYNVLVGKDIVMKSDGLAERSYCYIADLVSGLFAILLNGKAGETYNVANSHEVVSIYKLANTFASLSGGKSKVICNAPQNDKEYLNVQIDSMVADTSKLEELGWKPKINLMEGVRRTLSCYR